MINKAKDAILRKCKYLSEVEITQLQYAIAFSEEAHVGQTRATGEPYIIHPLEVCLILLEYQADLVSLICALLHDVVEDTEVSLSEIEQCFGTQVAFIVDGLTKFDKGGYEKEEYKAINIEKLLSKAMHDIRVAVVKLADRLHNMRTLAIKSTEKKIPYANETLLFFSPLAEKIGLYKLQEELEDLGFSYLNPAKYIRYKKTMKDYIQIYFKTFNKFANEVQKIDMNKDIIHIEWKKTPLFKSYTLLSEGQNISDLFTIHVTTSSTLNCYTALGIIHSLFEPLPNQFVDQIAIEKHQYIRYLETNIKIEQHTIRVIIHDETTHNFYENGVFGYLKETNIQNLSEFLFGNSIETVKSIAHDSVAFCELISIELFQKEITVFTSNMDSIVLPANSSIIDFAYAINPSLANRMAFAKVNGEVKSIQTILQDRDIVEIHTKEQIMVSYKWLLYVNTSKAIKEITKIIEID